MQIADESTTLVVYVNYFGCEDIKRSLKSLVRYVKTNLQIVVVDNSDKEDCLSLKEEFPDVCLIKSPRNLGFAGGCNLGVESADGEWSYLLLLNPDTYCRDDFLSPMVQAMGSDQSWGVIGPRIVREIPEGGVWYAGSTLNWWRGGPRHVYDERFSGAQSPVEVPFVSGCCMLIKRAVWDKAGALDDGYFLYFEDTDYIERVKRAGFRVGYMPEISVVHEESRSTGYQSPMFLYYFARNRILYMKLWGPKSAFVVFLLYNLLVKLPGVWVLFTLFRGKIRQSQAFSVGTLDGLRGLKGPSWRWHRH